MGISIESRKSVKPSGRGQSKRSKRIMDMVDTLLRSDDGRMLLSTIRECRRREKRLNQEIMELHAKMLEAELSLVRNHKIRPQDLFSVEVGVDMLELEDLRGAVR